MSIDYYNTRVRQAISDEYVKCGKRYDEYSKKYMILHERLVSEQDTLSHTEYVRICEEVDELIRLMRLENLKRDVWDEAREICLNIADELEESK